MNFLLGNKYLAIAKWIAIAAAVWYIFHTWDKAQGYDAIKAQLNAETACAPKSVCAVRILEEAKQAQKAVQEAQQQADIANAKAKEANERAAQAEAEKNAAKVKENNAKLAAILAKHTPACNKWREEIDPCATH